MSWIHAFCILVIFKSAQVNSRLPDPTTRAPITTMSARVNNLIEESLAINFISENLYPVVQRIEREKVYTTSSYFSDYINGKLNDAVTNGTNVEKCKVMARSRIVIAKLTAQNELTRCVNDLMFSIREIAKSVIKELDANPIISAMTRQERDLIYREHYQSSFEKKYNALDELFKECFGQMQKKLGESLNNTVYVIEKCIKTLP